MLKLTSSAFEPDQPIPKKYTGEGEDISPPLAWTGVPDNTHELALICDDPDAPMAEPFVHWVVYGLPADVSELPEGSSDGGAEGRNSFGKTAYGGPMPPPGHGTHHYRFVLYAVDTSLELGVGATKNAVLDAMQGHVLEKSQLVGTYER